MLNIFQKLYASKEVYSYNDVKYLHIFYCFCHKLIDSIYF